MSLSAKVLIIGVLVLVNGLLAAAETAVLSSRKGPLRKAVKTGVRGAAKALGLAENPSRFLVLVQFWLTLSGTIAGVLGGAELAADVAGHLAAWGFPAAWVGEAAFVLVVVGLAAFMLVFGELIPRRLASVNPERTAARLAGTMSVLAWLAAPVTRLLSLAADHAGRVAGVKSPANASPAVGDDEVRALVEQSLNAGVIQRAEKEMVDRVLALDDLRVTAIMTPRPKMVFLNIDDPEETNWRKIVASGHSYFPVYQGTRNQIVGVVAVKALWANSAIGIPAKLKDLVTSHLAVPDRMTGIQLLEQFKRSSRHFAIVVDEYGGVMGLITLIDVLEAIVGDMPDSASRAAPAARQRRDGTWLVDASLSSHDLKVLLKLDQPLPMEGEAEFKTLGGFVLAQFGRIPREADLFDWAGWRFEVMDMDQHRIDKVLISKSPVAGLQPPAPHG